MLVQLALAGELEDEKDALGVVEVSVQLQDVGVPQVALDLDLAAHLLLDPALLQLVLVQHLERADVAVGALAGQVHAAELALAQRPADLEHAQVHQLDGRLLNEHRDGGDLGGRCPGAAATAAGKCLSLGRGRLRALALCCLLRGESDGCDGVGVLRLQCYLVCVGSAYAVAAGDLRAGDSGLELGSRVSIAVWLRPSEMKGCGCESAHLGLLVELVVGVGDAVLVVDRHALEARFQRPACHCTLCV